MSNQASSPAKGTKAVERDLMRGAGPTAVLQILSKGEAYGYELVEAISQRTEGVLAMGQSTLYPMLYNLEAKGLIKAEWKDAPSGRRRKYYSLTPKGKRKLAEDVETWNALAAAMRAIGVLRNALVPSKDAGVIA